MTTQYGTLQRAFVESRACSAENMYQASCIALCAALGEKLCRGARSVRIMCRDDACQEARRTCMLRAFYAD